MCKYLFEEGGDEFIMFDHKSFFFICLFGFWFSFLCVGFTVAYTVLCDNYDCLLNCRSKAFSRFFVCFNFLAPLCNNFLKMTFVC